MGDTGTASDPPPARAAGDRSTGNICPRAEPRALGGQAGGLPTSGEGRWKAQVGSQVPALVCGVSGGSWENTSTTEMAVSSFSRASRQIPADQILSTVCT